MNIGLIISAISAVTAMLALRMAIKGSRRTDDRDTAHSAAQLTRMEATLESVRGGVDDIRVEMRMQQKQINDLSERLARTEESVKLTQKQLDALERDC
ncbi:MAG: hypothetical protein ACOYI5_09915 [Christensenellales bacterium]